MLKITLLHNLEGHTGAVYTLLQQPAGKSHFLAAGGDGQVSGWDASKPGDGELRAKVDGKIFCSAFSPDGNALLLGTFEGDVIQIKDKEVKRVRHHAKAVFGIFPRKEDFLSLSADGCLARWDYHGEEARSSFRLNYEGLRSCATFDSSTLIGGSNGALYFLDPEDFHIQQKIEQAHSGSIFTLLPMEDWGVFLSGAMDAQLNVWSPDGQLIKNIPAHLYTINHLVHLTGTDLIATASRDKTIKIWHGPELELLKVLDFAKYSGHTHSVNALLWLPDERLLISSGDDRKILVWHIDLT